MTAQTETFNLTADSRALTGKKVKNLRKLGQIPAVVYGHQKESLSLSLKERDFSQLFHRAGTTTLINLNLDDRNPVKVLIHAVQTEPLKNKILHVDFYQVNLKEKVRTEVPLEFIGTSEAVEVLDGTFVTIKDAVDIECLPEDLLHTIEVDISQLKTFEDSIRVKDLVVPPSVSVLNDPEETIAMVTEPRSEEEMAALDEALVEDVTAVESETGAEPTEGEEGGEERTKPEESKVENK